MPWPAQGRKSLWTVVHGVRPGALQHEQALLEERQRCQQLRREKRELQQTLDAASVLTPVRLGVPLLGCEVP